MAESVQYSHCDLGHVWTVDHAADVCPVCRGAALETSGKIATGQYELPKWVVPVIIAAVISVPVGVGIVTGDVFGFAVMAIPLLIFAPLIALFAVVGRRSRRRYAEAMEQFARERGFVFVPEMHHRLASRLQRLPLFQWGHSRSSVNVLQGRIEGLECIICRHQWVTGSGKNKTRHSRLVVVLMDVPGRLPEFELAPEHWYHKVGSWFGMKDINFGGSDWADVFSARYRLTGRNEDAVRDVFTEPVVRWFAEQPQWTVQSAANTLLFTRQQVTSTFRLTTSTDPVPTQPELDALLSNASTGFRWLTGVAVRND